MYYTTQFRIDGEKMIQLFTFVVNEKNIIFLETIRFKRKYRNLFAQLSKYEKTLIYFNKKIKYMIRKQISCFLGYFLLYLSNINVLSMVCVNEIFVFKRLIIFFSFDAIYFYCKFALNLPMDQDNNIFFFSFVPCNFFSSKSGIFVSQLACLSSPAPCDINFL